MIVFGEEDIRSVVSLDQEVIWAIENAFTALHRKQVRMPPIMRVDVPEHDGEVDVKSAYMKDHPAFAIKVSSGFFNNYALGLPSGNGLMLLVSTQTGVPQALLFDQGYLTTVRTAAAGAVAAKYLAPKKAQVAGIVGAGTQAYEQLKALQLVRSIEKVYLYNRNEERALALRSKLTRDQPQLDVVLASSPSEVLRQSQVVMTATPSDQPLLRAEDLHTGVHITAMGSDAEHKQELDPYILKQADLFVCDDKSQSLRIGEWHHADRLGIFPASHAATELGQITSGDIQGRTSEEQITVCDLTGTGVQDTAIALLAYQKLKAQGVGLTLEDR
ncbi:cyclodeaminase [Caldalkalibacillus salinus]|uniref:cyclodeaminase n=1 Tax=Caldalkalibacillus salinus TaxID=2803787 RepID=UPI0019210175|nr:cyclodeaminase [Caldalkalibacillus salinus]